MNVVHVVPSLDPTMGGPSQSVPALCHAISQAGAKVTLVTLGDGEDAAAGSSTGSWTLRATPPFPGTHEFPTMRFRRALAEAIAEADIVHLHALWNPAITLAARECRRAGVPYVLSPRGMLRASALAHSPLKKRLYRALLEDRTLRGAAALHFLNEAEAEDSLRQAPSGVRGILVPNGVDPELRATVSSGAWRKRHPEIGDRKVILFLGRLHRAKRLMLQCEAFAQLARVRSDVVWALVGPDAGEGPMLRREIEDRGLADRVVFDGMQSHERSVEALADADIVWLTSFLEGHSMAMNEALAVGAPLVVTDTVSFSALAEYGAAQIVPSTAEALMQGTMALLDDAGRRDQVRRAAAQLVTEQLSWRCIGEKMLDEYGSLIQ